ncbi:M56 family metallopeptidase [Rhodocytophaga rosea]|uniref:M56 family metallopeptidase n=1 Tax=Rhodocytophaga rosea TaxID=2704465 RepID=A0A6C0GRX1_9BACT|nr:M56 family metallopeptidase [Rhodocytophaga rosea]QHT70353.1 M56 family metallopeptidase [Rhodocytophaga rosea]
MTDIFFYSIKVALCLGIVYLFYIVALRRLTFYTANRWFLGTGSVLALFIPLASYIPFLQIREVNNVPSINALLGWNKVQVLLLDPSQSNSFWQDGVNLISIIFLVGTAILGSKLLMQLVAFYRIRHSASLLKDGAVKIYQVNKPIAPFSFGNHIFLNQQLLEPYEIRQVIDHEQVHVRQKHTLDVLWMECLLVFNWYNPFAWLLKQAVRENLEFIVDREVLLQDYSDKKGYQYLLLKIIGLSNVSIANPFNISSLKTRIHMMNRKPSNAGARGIYFLVLPMLILLTFTFCNRNQEDASPVKTAKGLRETQLNQNLIEKNMQINKINVQPDSLFTVELGSGKKEKYNLSDKKDDDLFEVRYDQLPPPPPPIVIKPLGNNVFEVDYNTGKKETYNLNNKSEAEIFRKKVPPPQTPVPASKDIDGE